MASIVYSLIIHVSEIEVHSKCEGILHANVSSQMCKHDNKQYSIWFHTTEDIWQFQFYSKCLITKNVNVFWATQTKLFREAIYQHMELNQTSSVCFIKWKLFIIQHSTRIISHDTSLLTVTFKKQLFRHWCINNHMSKKILTKAKNHIFTKFWQTESFCTG